MCATWRAAFSLSGKLIRAGLVRADTCARQRLYPPCMIRAALCWPAASQQGIRQQVSALHQTPAYTKDNSQHLMTAGAVRSEYAAVIERYAETRMAAQHGRVCHALSGALRALLHHWHCRVAQLEHACLAGSPPMTLQACAAFSAHCSKCVYE